MLWIVFALIAALSDALRSTFSKVALRTIDSYFVAWAMVTLQSIFLLPAFLFIDIPSLGSAFWPLFIGGSAMDIVATIFYMRAVQNSDLSIAIPLLSLSSLFLLVLSPLINQELPSLQGLIGVLVICVGTYALRVDRRQTGFFGPFRALYQERGARQMLVTAFLWSLTTSLHKEGILNSSPLFWPVAYYGWMSIIMLPLAAWKVPHFAQVLRHSLRSVVPIGFCAAAMSLGQMIALSLGLVVHVASIKNLNTLFAVLIGTLILQEQGIKERLFGALLMFVGTLLIAFS